MKKIRQLSLQMQRRELINRPAICLTYTITMDGCSHPATGEFYLRRLVEKAGGTQRLEADSMGLI